MTEESNADDIRDKKLKAFDHVLKSLNQKHMKKTKSEGGPGERLIAKLGDKPPKVKTVSSGSLVLDKALGGGIPKGRVIEIFGPEASGKTSIALTAVANVQKEGGTAAYIDLEHALDPYYAKVLGVEIQDLALAQPSTAEDALDLLSDLVDSQSVDVVVVDSVGALTPRVELENGMDDQTIGLVARILTKGLRKVVPVAGKNGTTVIFINQLRSKIGGYGGPTEETSGGKALKYFASQRVDVRRVERITEKGDFIGTKIRFNIVKNKVAPPFAKGETVLSFASGIDKVAELIEVGEEFGVVYRPNSRTYLNGITGERIGTSKADALEFVRNDEDLYEALAGRLSENIDLQRKGEPQIEPKTEEPTVEKSPKK